MAVPSKKSQGKLSVEALLERGLAHHRTGDVDAAERFYGQALRRAPLNATAWYLRSVIAMGAKDYNRAAELLEHAVKNAPGNGKFLCNLGEAYRRSGRLDEALAVLRRATTAEPELAVAHYNLGLVERDRKRYEAAIASFERVLSLDPNLAGLGQALVAAWSVAGRDDLAIVAYERLRGVLRDEASLRVAVANIYVENGLLDVANEHFARALELAPESADVHASCAVALADGGAIERAADHYRRALELNPGDRAAHGNMLFLQLFHPAFDGPTLRAEAEEFARRHVADVPVARHVNPPDPDRRLRIGYVSPDFRRHASAHFVLPLLRHHDRAEVEVFCYSNARGPDPLTAAFREQAATWRDVRSLDDEATARCIREDGVDILVDLAMHTADNRLMVFAKKPAPVQICYVAHLGTTGLSAMDYRITAPGLEPPSERDSWYTERSISLDDVYWCYDPLTDGPAVSELPAERTGVITFGSLNSFRKFNTTTASLWASVLRAVPDSRMLIHAPAGTATGRARAALAEEGVAPERLEFVGRMNRDEYLEAYARIDICLDALPYNGGTTSLDAYWMGVPVVTQVGRTVVGRAGYAINRALDLSELVATNGDEFVAIAVRLAADRGRLVALRRELRSRLERSPFMDAPRFARSFERAYRTIWREWCRRTCRPALAGLLALSLVFGCGAPTSSDGSDDPVAAASDPIQFGSPDTTHAGVVVVLSPGTQCSGAIVRVRPDGVGYVLTAAHCCTGPVGAVPTTIIVGQDAAAASAKRYQVDPGSVYYDAGYAGVATAFDFCMMTFSGAPASTQVLSLPSAAGDGLSAGASVEHVGYGQTAPPFDNDHVVRFHGTDSVDLPAVAGMVNFTNQFTYSAGGPGNIPGICPGDSGGPTLFPAGAAPASQFVVGVQSFGGPGNLMCGEFTFGGDSRVSSRIGPGKFIATYVTDGAMAGIGVRASTPVPATPATSLTLFGVLLLASGAVIAGRAPRQKTPRARAPATAGAVA